MDLQERVREFMPFVFHTSVTASLKVITANIDVLILGAMRPISDVAIFRIGRSAAMLVVLPTLPIRTVIYPELNEALAKRDLARARQWHQLRGRDDRLIAIGAVPHLDDDLVAHCDAFGVVHLDHIAGGFHARRKR